MILPPLVFPGLTEPGNTKGGSITVPLTFCLTGLDQSVLKIKTKIVSCHTADSKPVQQEVNSTVILPPLAFPDCTIDLLFDWFGLVCFANKNKNCQLSYS